MLSLGETQRARREQRLQVCLDVEVVDVATVLPPLLLGHRTIGQCRHALGLVETGHRQRTVNGRRVLVEHRARLEDTNARCLAVDVVSGVGHQAGDERGTHHAHLAGDRVQQLDGIGVAAEVGFPGAFHEAEVDHFLVILVGQQTTDGEQRTGVLRRDAHGIGGHRRQGRDVLETVDARDFLDQVFLDFDVEAIGRRGHREQARLLAEHQAQTREDIGHHLVGDGHADHLGGARGTQLHRLALGQVDDLVVHRADAGVRRAADFQQQRGDALDMLDHGGEIDTALEAMRRIGREVVATGTALDRLREPEGGFQIDIGGLQRDGGGIATHDAGQGFDFLVVRDHTDPLIDFDGVAVEELQGFTLAAPAHIQAAVDLVEIEHVRGTTQFQHHIVGDVHQRRDRALAAALQALLHPLRRGCLGIEATNDAASETAAQVGRGNTHRQLLVQVGRDRLEGRRLQRAAGQGRDFTRHAQHRQAIGLVGGELDGELEVVQLQVVAEVLAHRRIVGQLQQATMVFGELELARRAQHALRLHATQLADLDLERLAIGTRRQHRAHHGARHLQANPHIGSAADDIEDAAGMDVDAADVQTIRIRVLGDFQHFTHDHIGEGGRDRFDFLDFQAGHGQQMRELIRRHVRIDHGTQPVFRELHDSDFQLSASGAPRTCAAPCEIGLIELLQEAQVAFVEQAQVVDPITQHGQALKAGAERKTDVLLGIQTHVAHHARMHLAGTGDFQPAPLERTAAEGDVDLGRGLGEGEIGGTEAHLQVVSLEEGLDEVEVDALEVSEADVLGDPQAFDLVEHRRVGGIAVDAIGAARCNHLDRWLVHAGIAHLHRAGMGTQQQGLALGVVAFDVEGVLHRARRMVLGAVQCREIGPVGFDLGTVGNIKADGAEDFLDALPGAHHRMDAAHATATARQGDVDGFGIQARLHLGIGQGLAACGQRVFDLFLGDVDDRPLHLALFRCQLAQPLHLLGDLAGLAEILGLGVFQCGGVGRGGEISLRLRDQLAQELVQGIHAVNLAPIENPTRKSKKEDPQIGGSKTYGASVQHLCPAGFCSAGC
eukprot:TRINITY_DN785_c0_g5_i1.p2 TRINITY_DN785_c0_g5~~TRINITY_DN785_c0_g5_i1.p2  ORF type:complete len:1059 (-),score=367.39 TRINITY_DN785_c0_g5_i1:4151-7327(-)